MAKNWLAAFAHLPVFLKKHYISKEYASQWVKCLATYNDATFRLNKNCQTALEAKILFFCHKLRMFEFR